MKKIYYVLLLVSTVAFSQNKNEAELIVEQGIELYNNGSYDEAILKYNEALQVDKNNAYALAEKAMTLLPLKKYDEAVEICEQVLKLYPQNNNATVYVTYGNALDLKGDSKFALKIYDKGIKKYPDYYSLYYNQGITYYNLKQPDKAKEAFQLATKLNPNHASSFNALGILDSKNRIPSILALSRYLIIDNKTSRASNNFELLSKLMMQGVTQNSSNSISISIDENSLNNKKSAENNFSSLDLMLSMSGALNLSDENKNKNEIEKFTDSFNILCQGLKQMKKDNKGYYWEFLAPYFIEMYEKDLIVPFVNTLYLSVNNNNALIYEQENLGTLEQFYFWSKNYNWQ